MTAWLKKIIREEIRSDKKLYHMISNKYVIKLLLLIRINS